MVGVLFAGLDSCFEKFDGLTGARIRFDHKRGRVNFQVPQESPDRIITRERESKKSSGEEHETAL